jgi:hypothetical protein
MTPRFARPNESVVESTAIYFHGYITESGAVPDRFPPLGTQWRLHHSLHPARVLFSGVLFRS